MADVVLGFDGTPLFKHDSFSRDPFIALWCAVLERAILDYTSAYSDLAKDAEEWFAAASTEVGGFAWICNALGYDHNIVRQLVEEKVRSRS